MSSTMTYFPGPISSGEIHTTDFRRSGEIDAKHRLVAEFLESRTFDALLLQKSSNFSWFTSGGNCSLGGSADSAAALFITPEARVLVCNNVDSGQLFDRELPGLGFQLKERPWHEPKHILVEDLCRGRRVASDTGFGNTVDVSGALTDLRLPLTKLECEHLRELGKTVAHAVEATARRLDHGQTEFEIAGEVSHRLIKHGVVPERVQIWADGQGHRYRHWTYGKDRVEHYCVITAVGRRHGLCAGVSRTVAFVRLPRNIRDAHHAALLTQATGMYFSKPSWELFETWKRVERIYEKFGYPDEWQLAEQADVVGYELSEVPVVPKSEFRLAPRMALYWHPSVGPAVVGDTILLNEEGLEILTPTQNWPMVQVRVKGVPFQRPDILERENG